MRTRVIDLVRPSFFCNSSGDNSRIFFGSRRWGRACQKSMVVCVACGNHTFDSFLFYLVILSLGFVAYIWSRGVQVRRVLAVPAVLFLIFLFFTFLDYQNNFKPQGLFVNSAEVGDYVRNLPEDFDLYGSHELAPLVALQAGRELFDNRIDTNTQAFASGAQNLEDVSLRAVQKGVYLVARIQDYPEYGIKDYGYSGYFSESMFNKFCSRLKDFPVAYSNEKVVIYECKI